MWHSLRTLGFGFPFMSKPLPIGARGEAEETVEFKHTLTAHHSSLPPVYSTPDMICLMETAHSTLCNHIAQMMRSRWGRRFTWSIARPAGLGRGFGRKPLSSLSMDASTRFA